MKIIADENMPNAEALFSHLGQVTLVNGRTLTAEQVKDADVLLVRSVTKVTSQLLAGSKVRFVGSATIGVDHIDLPYLKHSGIDFTSAPGCNAEAVADYVFSGLSHLFMTKGLPWLSKKIGIVGYGNVGRTVYQRFLKLGCEVCVFDPYQASSAQANTVNFVSLAEVLSCGVISLHAPLTNTGDYPTQGMIGANELALLSAGSIIVSAGRGGVIDEEALMQRHKELKHDLHLIMDVWAGEPSINPNLLSIVDIATPHIAGYSKQGREKGTLMVYQGLCRHLGIPLDNLPIKQPLSLGWVSTLSVKASDCKEEVLARAIQAVYDLARDDARLRFKYREKNDSSTFDWLRKHYVERDELNTCQVISLNTDQNVMLAAVGFLAPK
ncbi:4-phosphoerythronate dehydrogenase [Marinomonas sp. A79]|uniref:Erythronate-4-phosphate dehydrogenase n=1 Tax=Marinomonas vulgaris TaxID=2823372 RepID=A0ABS5HG74_9GAMM|nr:4-phosphoerythronate dehydrogenase [Marinomonas vulgaris]MBR7889929.1 4-phosphoerythronate dehydrogenase [Marinomonas vulgaris]